jgi:hypothetical protein
MLRLHLGIRVVTASRLVILKLFGLRRLRSDADAAALLKTGHVDLSGWPLLPENVSAHEVLVQIAKTDPD